MAQVNLRLPFKLIIDSGVHCLSVLCRRRRLQKNICSLVAFPHSKPHTVFSVYYINHILQLCNKTLHGEALTIAVCSVSLLLVVDVNLVLLVAAAPFQAYLVYVEPPFF